MGERVHALFTRPAARRPAVTATVLPAPASQPPGQRPGIGGATRERCACGHVVGTTAEVWQELRGGHLRAYCPGCVQIGGDR